MIINKRDFLRLSAAVTAGSVLSAPSVLRAANEKILIGLAQPLNNTAWRAAMANVNRDYAAKNFPDVEFLITDAQNQTTKQVADVESLVSRGVKVLMISPMDQQALAPVIRETMANGVKVVTLDRTVNTPVTCHVGAKNLPIGKAAGEFMAKKLSGKGQIIEVMGGAGSSPAIERSKGFREALGAFPEMKIIAEQYCEWQRAAAMKFMEDMLQRFGPGEIQGVYCHADDSGLGVVQVLKENGRLSDIAVVSIDGANAAFQAVADGDLAADFSYPFCAPEGVQVAYKIAKGEVVDAEVVLEGKGVFPENVKDYLGKGF